MWLSMVRNELACQLPSWEILKDLILPCRFHDMHAHQSMWWRPFTIFYGRMHFPWKWYFLMEIPFSAMAGDDISMEEYAMAMDGFSMEFSATAMESDWFSMEMQNKISPDPMQCFSMELHRVPWMWMEKRGQYSIDNFSMEMHGSPCISMAFSCSPWTSERRGSFVHFWTISIGRFSP